jgi:hypothetical protein
VDALRVKAPGALAVGAVADASASLDQAGRRVQAGYPMSVEWPKSLHVHVGAPATASPLAVVAYDPATGKLTALRPGTAELTVRVNGAAAGRTITVR